MYGNGVEMRETKVGVVRESEKRRSTENNLN